MVRSARFQKLFMSVITENQELFLRNRPSVTRFMTGLLCVRRKKETTNGAG